MKKKKRRSRKFDLEKEYGYKFIIHQRDFMPGATIRANVTEAVTKSRRIVIIFSRYVTIYSLPFRQNPKQ